MALADTFFANGPNKFLGPAIRLTCFHPHPYTWTAVSICIDILCPAVHKRENCGDC